MAKSQQKTLEELLQDLIIVQLGIAGIQQLEIQKIVGVGIVRVNNIVKHLKKANQNKR